jgi:hypothetical protein
MYDRGFGIILARSPTITPDEAADKRLLTAIMKSYFEDIEKYIKMAVIYSPQNSDYYMHLANSLILQMLQLKFFNNNIKYMNIRLEEIINMAYTKKEKKEKNEGIKVEFKGTNKNVFSASVWKPKKFEKKGFTRFFTILSVNGVSIVGSIMIPEGAEGEWDSLKDIAKDAFFAFPSYYNEDTKKYSNQVFIKDDGLKEDLDEFVEYAIAEAKLLDI